jgi:hypothetical protein
LFKTALKIEFVFEAIVLAISGAVWAIAGSPHFTEVATFGGSALVCVGAYIGIIWNLKE